MAKALINSSDNVMTVKLLYYKMEKKIRPSSGLSESVSVLLVFGTLMF